MRAGGSDVANPIRKIKTLAGTVVWQVDGRKFNAAPRRPQFATKEQAETALSEMIARRGAGLHPGRRDITFAAQAEALLKNSADALAGKTLRAYSSTLQAHLLPAFGNKRVIDISTAQIKAFLAEKRAPRKVVKIVTVGEGRCRDRTTTIPVGDFDSATMRKLGPEVERQLAPASVQQLRATLSVVFQSAVEDGLISVNPLAAIRLGRRGRKARVAASVAVAEEKPFTEAERDALLRWCAETDAELGDFLALLFKTGCRIGEGRALRWGDIHPDYIQIERNVDDKGEITLTKTGLARKVELAADLKKILAARFVDRQRTGHGTGATDYVFGNGAPIAVRKLARRWEAARDACGLASHRLYDCRSTFASVLLTRGAPLLWVSKMLGHSDAVTTLKSYARWMPTESRGHINLLDQPPALAATDRAEMKSATC
jgi:integrase